MAMLAAIAPIAQVIGAGVGALGAISSGRAQREAGEWQQRESERQAMAERASAQREADQLARRTELAQSRLQTVGAASGFSSTDPTALNLSEDIARYGTLQQQMAMYGGADRATGLRAQGTLARYSGDQAEQASYYRAAGAVLGGLGGLARYRDSGTGGNAGYTFG